MSVYITIYGIQCMEKLNMTSQSFVKLLFSSFRPYFFHQVVKCVNLTCVTYGAVGLCFPQCRLGKKPNTTITAKQKLTVVI